MEGSLGYSQGQERLTHNVVHTLRIEEEVGVASSKPRSFTWGERIRRSKRQG